MKESYREGVASHSGPEPCEGGGNVALEALDRGICRLGIELRNQGFRGADGVSPYGRQQRAFAITRARRGPAESKTPGMQRNSMRENRETPSPPVEVGDGVSRFSRMEFLCMPGVFDSAGPRLARVIANARCCLPYGLTPSAPRNP